MHAIDLESGITIKYGLIIVGGGILLLLGFLAWFFDRVLVKRFAALEEDVAKLKASVTAVELRLAEQSGARAPDRIGVLEDRTRQLELSIVVLQAGDAAREKSLAAGLSMLNALGDRLKDDMRRGDMESRLDSAEAMVAARQVAVTLAKIQGPSAEEQEKKALAEALQDLADLKAEQLRLNEEQKKDNDGQKPVG